MIRSALLFLAPFAILATASAAETQVFTIKTLPAQMRYDVTELTIAPGANVKIIFENPDDMPHNMVFFQPGTDVVAVCNKQMEKPEEALKRNWLPEDPRLWLHSKMLNPKEKEELVFKAPDKPGVYPFVCSAPGHAMTMQGRLKIFAPGPQITGLKFQMYLGDWSKLPDFSKLQPHREGEIEDNLIQLKLDDYKNQFGVVYTGKVKARKDGEYTFAITSDDGTRLLVNGKKVVEADGIHPAGDIKEGKIRLKEGEHDIRVEYFQGAGEAEIFTAWAGPDFTMTPLSKWTPPNWKSGAVTKKRDNTTGMPLVVSTEPVIYRNFIQGAGNRGIGVGYPGAMNIAWSAETFNLAIAWRGAFIDAARHWIDRGAGHQPPLGYDVVRPTGDGGVPFLATASPEADWPRLEKNQRAEGYSWKGYQLDARRFPTFLYEWNGVKVSDRFDVEGNAVAGAGKLIRTIKLSGNIPANAFFRVASGNDIQPTGSAFLLDRVSKVSVEVDGAKLSGKNLVLPLRPEIKVTYSWPSMHGSHAHASAHAH
jgi:azurin